MMITAVWQISSWLVAIWYWPGKEIVTISSVCYRVWEKSSGT